METRIQSFDWSRTSLGPRPDWPENLRAAVSICLASLHPIVTLTERMITLQEDERRYLASELHDEIGQLLTGLRLLVGSASRKASRHNSEELEEATRLIDETLQRVRNISIDLRPPMLEKSGLLAIIQWHAKRFGHKAEMDIDITTRGNPRRLPPELELAAFRIVQEALTNIARHAPGASTSIVADFRTSELIVEVNDDGPGFDTEEAEKIISNGIPGMRLRAAMFNGSLLIESERGEGSSVVARLPVTSSEAGGPSS